MMCQRIGLPPTSTIGFGRNVVSSAKRVPKPPARITAFIHSLLLVRADPAGQSRIAPSRAPSLRSRLELRGPRRAREGALQLSVVLQQLAQRTRVDAPGAGRDRSAPQLEVREQPIGCSLMVY